MATTKSSKSKAKPKTSKKPATKSAKSTTKSTAVKVTPKSKTSKVSLNLLYKLNLTSAVLGIVIAVAAVFLMSSARFQLFVGHLTDNAIESTEGTVFVPAIHTIYSLELKWLVALILLVSVVVPLLAATKKRKTYEDSVSKKVVPSRWIDMAIVSALMLEVIAILTGVQDVMVLKLIVGLMIVTNILGWFSEKHQAAKAGTGRGVYVLSLFTGSLPWLIIASYAFSTVVWGMVRSPWYVYALYATTLLAFTGYGLNGLRRLKAQQEYTVTERNYQVLSIFAKTAFALVLIVGLAK